MVNLLAGEVKLRRPEIARVLRADGRGTPGNRQLNQVIVALVSEIGAPHESSDTFSRSDEPAAQVERLRYHLAHGVKECLVDQVKRWHGVHFAKSILGGKPLKGLWFDRTQEYAAKNRGEDFGRLKYAEEEELVLSQLPCWGDLTPEQYRERIAGLVKEIEAEARADREVRGIEPLGVEAILRVDSQAPSSLQLVCHRVYAFLLLKRLAVRHEGRF